MSHANACLTPAGRLRLAELVVDQGWPLRRAAERWNCSVTTAKRWADRYQAQGRAGLGDRSSRPKSSPRRTPTRIERRVVGLRVSRRWGPARIAYRLRLQPSTVHKILARYGCPPLAWTDPATGVRIKSLRRKVHSYVHDAPGDMVYVDIKKLGRIPDGGGHKVLGRVGGPKDRARRGMGYWYIHNAIDDHTRLGYSELLTDERKETAACTSGRSCSRRSPISRGVLGGSPETYQPAGIRWGTATSESTRSGTTSWPRHAGIAGSLTRGDPAAIPVSRDR